MRLFTEHPASAGQSYLQHLVFAGRVGLRMVLGGLACLAHGLLPFLFQTTGSRTIRALHADVTRPRAGQGDAPGATPDAAPGGGRRPEPEYLI